ncbi:MAG: BrnT family toxin [Anaerolineae bacterium]
MADKMQYHWDPRKARTNLRKHGVAFTDAVTALADDAALTIEDDEEGEERFVTLGMDALGRMLVVVYTCRGEDLRIISARRATAREREEYKRQHT